MDVITNFNITENIWKNTPGLLSSEVFRNLYDSDKSKGRENSSKVLWALFLCYHPESTWKNLPIKKREELIKKEYLKDPKFNFTKYPKEIGLIEESVLTPAKRQLYEWKRIMDEKTIFMKTLTYDIDTWETLEQMLKSNKSLYEEYKRISDSLEREGSDGVVQGQSIESAAEKGLI